ncbi:MAG TPA: COX15/CtaA family protein, partial [Gemmatimonadales bacterium]|nr:COX15/CtaA family protein [Gemmatimonadales bacterium]
MHPRLRPVHLWLLAGCALIALMVVVGGITRLTGSGLSITEWDLLGGTLPPSDDAAWRALFAKYQATPQYLRENSHFGLAEFKSIFWWEWIHRFLGRAVGVVFVVPFAWFLATGRVARALLPRLLLLLGLGAAQGLVGWLMVASGLVDDPRVSHYRLAAHLLLAFTTFAATLWTALGLRAGLWSGEDAPPRPPAPALPGAMALLALLAVQVAYGAFVAGLRAGFLYNTFPTMGGHWVPPGMGGDDGFLAGLTSAPVTVQFVHRVLGVLVAAGAVAFALRWRQDPGVGRAAAWLGGMALLQFGLGALAVLRLPADPVFWGTVHQSGALALLAAVIVT